MSTTHTPGPWTASQYLDDGRWGVVTQGNGIVVSLRSRSPSEATLSEADARLIAAAPELLQAARDFISWGTGAGYRFESGSPLDRARDAIDKAEGRT